MSFGFGVSDFLLVLGLARATYTSCIKAPREFREAAQAVKSLYVVLKALEEEANDPGSPLLRNGQRAEDVAAIMASCLSVLADLDKIAVKYSSLGTDDPRLWHRLRFPNGHIGELTRKLAYYTSTLSFLLDTIGLGALGRLELQMEQKLDEAKVLGTNMNRKLDDATCERREILKAVHDLGYQYRAGARENSILSAHTDDSKCVKISYVI
jgi:hypothetical protein